MNHILKLSMCQPILLVGTRLCTVAIKCGGLEKEKYIRIACWPVQSRDKQGDRYSPSSLHSVLHSSSAKADQDFCVSTCWDFLLLHFSGICICAICLGKVKWCHAFHFPVQFFLTLRVRVLSHHSHPALPVSLLITPHTAVISLAALWKVSGNRGQSWTGLNFSSRGSWLWYAILQLRIVFFICV